MTNLPPVSPEQAQKLRIGRVVAVAKMNNLAADLMRFSRPILDEYQDPRETLEILENVIQLMDDSHIRFKEVAEDFRRSLNPESNYRGETHL